MMGILVSVTVLVIFDGDSGLCYGLNYYGDSGVTASLSNNGDTGLCYGFVKL
jgi:hypothetical protein